MHYFRNTLVSQNSPHLGQPLHFQQASAVGQWETDLAVTRWTVASSSHQYSYWGSWRHNACGSLAHILARKTEIRSVSNTIDFLAEKKKKEKELKKLFILRINHKVALMIKSKDC